MCAYILVNIGAYDAVKVLFYAFEKGCRVTRNSDDTSHVTVGKTP